MKDHLRTLFGIAIIAGPAWLILLGAHCERASAHEPPRLPVRVPPRYPTAQDTVAPLADSVLEESLEEVIASPRITTLHQPRTLDELLSAPVIDHGYLGVKIKPDAKTQNPVITQVFATGAAAKAGLQVGDQIVSLDNFQMATVPSVLKFIEARPPGKVIQVKVLRNNQHKRVLATLQPAVVPVQGKDAGSPPPDPEP